MSLLVSAKLSLVPPHAFSYQPLRIAATSCRAPGVNASCFSDRPMKALPSPAPRMANASGWGSSGRLHSDRCSSGCPTTHVRTLLVSGHLLLGLLPKGASVGARAASNYSFLAISGSVTISRRSGMLSTSSLLKDPLSALLSTRTFAAWAALFWLSTAINRDQNPETQGLKIAITLRCS